MTGDGISAPTSYEDLLRPARRIGDTLTSAVREFEREHATGHAVQGEETRPASTGQVTR
jgi:hypothetical protein